MLLHFTHQLDPVAFQIGSFSIAWYGLTWSASILVGYSLGQWFFKREGKDEEKLFNLAAFIFLACLLGARLSEMLFYQWDYFSENPLRFFRFRDGGLSSHGAVALTLITVYLFSRKHKEELPFLWITDKMAIVGAISGSFIRFGNFINGELYGTPTDLPWAVVFMFSDPLELPRHPTQIYESLWFLCCFIILLVTYLKGVKRGVLSALFLILVLGGRIVLESTKALDGYILGLAKTQWMSVPFVILGFVLLIWAWRNNTSSQIKS